MPFLLALQCLSHCNLRGRCRTSWSSIINVVASLRTVAATMLKVSGTDGPRQAPDGQVLQHRRC